jgi:hypothetical protein
MCKSLLVFHFYTIYTHSRFAPIVASGKEYFNTFLKKLLGEKNQRKFEVRTLLLPKQSNPKSSSGLAPRRTL